MRSTVVWIPDVFGYPASLPQIFDRAAARRFVTQKLSWNKQNVFPHNTFWWEGLDGSRVLTHFPPVDTYNAEITPAEMRYAETNFKEHGWSDWALMPFGHGNGGGGPTREMMERAGRMADLDGVSRISVGTPDEFFDHVEAEIDAGAPVPIWAGELYFEMHRGTLTSQAATKVGNRRCERLLREAELWWAPLAGRRRRSQTSSSRCGRTCCCSSSTTSSRVRRSPGCMPTLRRRTLAVAERLEAIIADALCDRGACDALRRQRGDARPARGHRGRRRADHGRGAGFRHRRTGRPAAVAPSRRGAPSTR